MEDDLNVITFPIVMAPIASKLSFKSVPVVWIWS